MIVNVVNYGIADATGEPCRVGPVRALLCADCKTHYKWEAHRNYIDIQFVAAGVERIGWAPIGRLALSELYHETKDIAFYQGEGDFVTVPAGSFVILFPEDAHMPGIAVGTPAPVTKIVVKVHVS